jgi:hypothetical protein
MRKSRGISGFMRKSCGISWFLKLQPQTFVGFLDFSSLRITIPFSHEIFALCLAYIHSWCRWEAAVGSAGGGEIRCEVRRREKEREKYARVVRVFNF